MTAPSPATTPAPTARLTVGSSIDVWTDGLSPGTADALAAALSFPNPEYGARLAAGRSVAGVAPRLHYARRHPGRVVVPRGAFHVTRRLLVERGHAVVVDSRVTSVALPGGEAYLGVDAPAGHDPRPYQLDAEERMLRGVQGYVVLPCGGGKTFVGARAIVRSGHAALVFVHSEDLADQWAVALYRASGTAPRLLGGDHPRDWRRARPGEHVVALTQSIDAAGAEAQPLLSSVGAVLLDEAHRAPTAQAVGVFGRCPARYRWGLTATPERADGLGYLLGIHVGPELYRRSARELAADGYLSLPRVLMVRSGWAASGTCSDPRTGRLDWSRAVAELSADPARNDTIVALARAAVDAGRQTLVLVHRVEHAGRLAARLRAEGVCAEAVTGAVERRHRKRRVAGLRSGRVDCLVATQLADEGLDLPGLGCLVMAAPQRAEGRALQRLGRLTRPKADGSTPLCFDLVDGGLSGQARARAVAYAREYSAPVSNSVSVQDAISILQGI